MPKKYFLIASSVRSGTTYLGTSLNELPGVTFDYELKWKPHFELHEVHVLMTEPGWRCKPFLESLSADAEIVCSKLALEAEVCLRRDDVPEILETVEEDVAIVHLTRNNFDIIMSLQLRGSITALNRPLSSLNSGKRVLLDAHEKETEWLEVRGGYPSIKPTHDFNGMKKLALNLFQNDLIVSAIANKAARSMRLDYASIFEILPRVAEFVGYDADPAAIEEVRDNPVTRKLPALDPNGLPEADRLRTWCNLLYDKMQLICEMGMPYDEIWREDGDISILGLAPDC